MSVGRERFWSVTCIKRKRLRRRYCAHERQPFRERFGIFTRSSYYSRRFVTDGGMVGVNVGIPVPTAYFPSPVISNRSSVIFMFLARMATISLLVQNRDVPLVR